MGTAAAVVKPAGGGLLLDKGEVRKSFEIVPTSYTMAVTDTLRVREGESDLLTKLNALASTEPEGVLGQGTLSWTYNDQPVQADTLSQQPGRRAVCRELDVPAEYGQLYASSHAGHSECLYCRERSARYSNRHPQCDKNIWRRAGWTSASSASR